MYKRDINENVISPKESSDSDFFLYKIGIKQKIPNPSYLLLFPYPFTIKWNIDRLPEMQVTKFYDLTIKGVKVIVE